MGFAEKGGTGKLRHMSAFLQIEPQVLALPQKERARLAALLLNSLPADLDDDDEGIAEALRREQEGVEDPSVYLSAAEFDQRISAWRTGAV